MTDDEALLALVGEALAAADPVPERVRAAALAAYARRRADAALAELSADSAGDVPAGVRAGYGARVLTFTGPDVVVEIEVTGEGAEREIAGRLSPARPAQIAVRHPDGELAGLADDAGHFVVRAVPAGPVSLAFALADASSVVTSWVRL
jgi:hypothetical protein